MIVRHSFTPPNNTHLGHVCGPMDEHLRRIEAALQVGIAHRHEQFKIDGHKAKANRALEVLQAMYEIAARPIAPDTVQLMLAGDSSLAEAADGSVTQSSVMAPAPAQGGMEALVEVVVPGADPVRMYKDATADYE